MRGRQDLAMFGSQPCWGFFLVSGDLIAIA